ncbi:hypothetical protein APHAL10511_007621 [Amanita phalloides]|nr:hypothetical protein APHAL10511_007621 [Amanita phalloides]
MWQTLIPELVFEIFRHFLPRLKLSVIRPKLFPWYLGQICSSWRDVFVSSPEFWCHLDFHLDVDFDVDRGLVISNVCLPRSNPRPISFTYIQDYPPDENQKLERCRQILNLLINQSTRWRDAYFEVHVAEIPFIYPVKNKLPILRSIKVKTVGGIEISFGRCYPDPIFDDLFLDAPQLKRMCISGNPYWKVNWSSLKTIHISLPYHYPEHLEVLSRVSCLEELTIDGNFNTIPDIVHSIVLPFLKILRSDSTSLPLFKTPMLNELCIRHINSFSDLNDTLRNFIPSLGHLTQLTLISRCAGDVEILLQHMPRTLSECTKSRHLKTLSVTVFNSTEDAVDMIKMWMRRKSLPKGAHRFDELECFYLELHKNVSHLLDQLKSHLDSEGIPHSMQQEYVHPFDTFDVFDD